MIGDIEGYCWVKVDADIQSPIPSKEFRGKIIRCVELNTDTKSILMLSNCGTALGMTDFDQTEKWFKCSQYQGWILPPNLSSFERMGYVAALVQNVKIEDRDLLLKLVISNSLTKGEFCSVVYDRLQKTEDEN